MLNFTVLKVSFHSHSLERIRFTDTLSDTVQCTKGKCAKSFHVSCALAEGSGVFLDATLPEVGGGEVSVLAATKAGDAPPSPSKAVASSSAGVEEVMPQIEPEGELKLTILCRTHNPVSSLLPRHLLQPSISLMTRGEPCSTGLETARTRSQSRRTQRETRISQTRRSNPCEGLERNFV